MEMITNSDCLLRSSVINSFIYCHVSVGMLSLVSSNYVPVRLVPTSRNEVLKYWRVSVYIDYIL